jgi:hypothetical protein
MKHLEEIECLSPETLRLIICSYILTVKHTRKFNRTPIWSAVGALFNVGSASAYKLCRQARLVPDQQITAKLEGWHSFESIQCKGTGGYMTTKHGRQACLCVAIAPDCNDEMRRDAVEGFFGTIRKIAAELRNSQK